MDYIKTKIIAGGLLFVIVLIALFSVLNNKYERYVMFFKNSVNSKIETEIRYIPPQDIEPMEVYFFKELMLGPVNHDRYSFFNRESKLLSCFVRNGTLYVDFPASFMEVICEDFDSEEIKNLLAKNIFLNCKNLKSVYIAVEGVQIYDLLKNNAEI